MGPGYPLFFLFIKCCTVIIASILVIFGIYAIHSNNAAGACYNEEFTSTCYASYATLYSYYNSGVMDKRVAAIQQYLCLAVMICLVPLLQIMRYLIRKTSTDCDARDVSSADYTLMVENIPIQADIDYMSEIKKFFEGLSTPESPKIVVEKINLAFKITQFPE